MSGFGEPGTIIFADRFSHRLQLKWKPLTYVPHLEHVLDEFRRTVEDPSTLIPLDSPLPWQGLVRKAPKGWVTHAGRYFEDTRLLVEATLTWPARRDENLERNILKTIDTVDASGPTRPWRAMGLDLQVDSRLDLRGTSNKVGKISWEFAAGMAKWPLLTVQRLALPQYWLKDTMREWLKTELPKGHKPLHQNNLLMNRHPAERLVSAAGAGPIAHLRDLRMLHVDVGWLCPVEERVYRVSYLTRSTQDDLELPELLSVRCCHDRPVLEVSQ